MIRFIFYIILTYIIFFILRYILNIFRRGRTAPPPPPQNNTQKTVNTLDKSKIVDADFEEIK
jgi:hypothetical protein